MAISKKTLALITARHLDCYGSFDMSDPICKKHCILSLRCIVEKNKYSQVGLWEDFILNESISMRRN